MISKRAVIVFPSVMPLPISVAPRAYSRVASPENRLILMRDVFLLAISSSSSKCILLLANGAKANMIIKLDVLRQIRTGNSNRGNKTIKKKSSKISENIKQPIKLFA